MSAVMLLRLVPWRPDAMMSMLHVAVNLVDWRRDRDATMRASDGMRVVNGTTAAQDDGDYRH